MDAYGEHGPQGLPYLAIWEDNRRIGVRTGALLRITGVEIEAYLQVLF